MVEFLLWVQRTACKRSPVRSRIRPFLIMFFESLFPFWGRILFLAYSRAFPHHFRTSSQCKFYNANPSQQSEQEPTSTSFRLYLSPDLSTARTEWCANFEYSSAAAWTAQEYSLRMFRFVPWSSCFSCTSIGWSIHYRPLSLCLCIICTVACPLTLTFAMSTRSARRICAVCSSSNGF